MPGSFGLCRAFSRQRRRPWRRLASWRTGRRRSTARRGTPSTLCSPCRWGGGWGVCMQCTGGPGGGLGRHSRAPSAERRCSGGSSLRRPRSRRLRLQRPARPTRGAAAAHGTAAGMGSCAGDALAPRMGMPQHAPGAGPRRLVGMRSCFSDLHPPALREASTRGACSEHLSAAKAQLIHAAWVRCPSAPAPTACPSHSAAWPAPQFPSLHSCCLCCRAPT